MRRFHIFLLLLLFSITGAHLGAQEDPLSSALLALPQEHPYAGQVRTTPMTLAEVEQAALSNNPELRLSAQRIALAEARQGEAGSLDDLTFMYRGWSVPLRQPWNFNQAQNMFMLSQALPGPGKRGLRSDIAAQDVMTAKAALEAVRRRILAEVRVAYYELLRNRDELRVHDQQVALARQALKAAQIKYTVGRVPQQDVLRAQIAVTRLIDHLIMFQKDGALARARLNALMGRDPAAPLEVTGEYRQVERLPGADDLKRIALSARPELQAATSAVRRSELASQLARKAYTPDFNVSGGYMLMPGGTPDGRHAYMAELSMTLPWLNRSKHNSEIEQAQATRDLQQAEYERLRQDVFREIQEALIRAQAAKQLVDIYQHTLRPQAQATFKAARAAYETDRADFLSLLDSQNTMLEVEYDYYQSLAQLDQQLAELEAAVGAPLERSAHTPEEMLP
jgi:cobalt-zinc-cadmium efflux system outer membrane protein